MRFLLSMFALMLGIVPSHAQMYDPFQKSTKMKKVHSSSLLLLPPPPILAAPIIAPTTVTAVMNTKAFINGEWHKVGDHIDHQEITSIQPNFVTLKEGNRLTILGVGSQQRVFSTKEAQ